LKIQFKRIPIAKMGGIVNLAIGLNLFNLISFDLNHWDRLNGDRLNGDRLNGKSVAIAEAAEKPPDSKLRNQCPTELEPLVMRMVQDLPSYANRANIKGKTRSQLAMLNHVVTARQPEFEPIDLPSSRPDPSLRQVFITTLEHQTISGQRVQFQQYHWLFLVRTRLGWRLSQSFSRSRLHGKSAALTELRESQQGAVAQGVKVWLRDCEAGAIAGIAGM
jgi:hypothetical protein